MLHILWTILTIIGILLFLVLLVLFFPVCYRVKGSKDGELIDVTIKVHWLFGFLSFVFSYKEKIHSMKLKVLGFDILQFIVKKKDKKQKEERMDKLPKKEDTKHEDIVSKNIEKREEEPEQKKSFIEKIKGIPVRIVEKIKNILLTIKEFYDKINHWKELLSDERMKIAVVLAKTQLFKIIKHVLPKKIKGQITYGFEDPCTTGQVLAGVSMIYPWYAKSLRVNPDFSKAVLDGNVDLKGRIYLIMFVKTFLVVFFNKNIQYVIHIFRNKEES